MIDRRTRIALLKAAMRTKRSGKPPKELALAIVFVAFFAWAGVWVLTDPGTTTWSKGASVLSGFIVCVVSMMALSGVMATPSEAERRPVAKASGAILAIAIVGVGLTAVVGRNVWVAASARSTMLWSVLFTFLMLMSASLLGEWNNARADGADPWPEGRNADGTHGTKP